MVDSGSVEFIPCSQDSPATFEGMSRVRMAEYGQGVTEVRRLVTSQIEDLDSQVSPTDEQRKTIADIADQVSLGKLAGYMWRCARQQELGKCALVDGSSSPALPGALTPTEMIGQSAIDQIRK